MISSPNDPARALLRRLAAIFALPVRRIRLNQEEPEPVADGLRPSGVWVNG